MASNVDKLNEQVDAIMKKAIEKNGGDLTTLEPVYKNTLHTKTVMKAGKPIYEARSKHLTIVYMVAVLAGVIWATVGLGLLRVLLLAAICFVEYDMFSGILHVVFDHPDNIALPILGQPALEFQWHHAIPDDICKRDFLHICGDLNVSVSIFVSTFLVVLTNPWTGSTFGPLAAGAVSMKVLFAYVGQFSHRSAHEISIKKRGKFVQQLQKWGVIISVGDHHRHHTPPHDNFFCLIGPCNVVLEQMLKLSKNRRVWLCVLASWVVLCCPVIMATYKIIAN